MRADGLRLPPTQSEVYGEIERIRGNVQPRKIIYPAWVKYDENWIYYGTTNPQHIITKSTLQAVFSDSPAAGGVATGQWSEDEIAEAIFDWWISGKPYKQWYAEKYLQLKLDFQDETETSEEDNGLVQG